MVGGGLFAVKKYVLDVRWADDVAPLADEVAAASGVSFDHAVDVRTQPTDEFALGLARATLGVEAGSAAATTLASEWRSLGLLGGELDLGAIGLAAMPSAPAYYDPAGETVYVIDGLPQELRTFAVHRALALALLDQEFGWGRRAAAAAPATRAGTQALYDAAALEIALRLVDDSEREAILGQVFGLYGTYPIPSSPSPYGSVVAGRLGVAAWPLFRGASIAASPYLANAAPTDAQVLDLRRLVSGVPEATTANARGMLYWYHVLAARLDDDVAWRTALTWAGDSVTVLEPTATSSSCVAAMFQATLGDTSTVRSAFEQWAQAAPQESLTTVSAVDANGGIQITINACDPGAAVATTDGSAVLGLGAAPLRSEQMRQLSEAQTGISDMVAACAAAFGGSVSMADERGVIDPVGGWPVALGRSLPDPVGTGCAPAA